nr:MAG TPA: hypothetical protein [Bacteriophage sp.]DAW87901.1 MAG TPA: hypothetical protein [Bacteriophage sp.]
MPQVASDIDLVLRLGILALGAFRLRQILRLEIAERVDASDEGLRSPYVAAFFLGLRRSMLRSLLDLDHLPVVGHKQHQRVILLRLFPAHIVRHDEHIEQLQIHRSLTTCRSHPAVSDFGGLRVIVERHDGREVRLRCDIHNDLREAALALERELDLLLAKFHNTGFHRGQKFLAVEPVEVLEVPIENQLHTSVALNNDAISRVPVHRSTLQSGAPPSSFFADEPLNFILVQSQSCRAHNHIGELLIQSAGRLTRTDRGAVALVNSSAQLQCGLRQFSGFLCQPCQKLTAAKQSVYFRKLTAPVFESLFDTYLRANYLADNLYPKAALDILRFVGMVIISELNFQSQIPRRDESIHNGGDAAEPVVGVPADCEVLPALPQNVAQLVQRARVALGEERVLCKLLVKPGLELLNIHLMSSFFGQ